MLGICQLISLSFTLALSIYRCTLIEVDNLCDNHNLRQSIDQSIRQKFAALELRTISVFVPSLSPPPPSLCRSPACCSDFTKTNQN